MLSDVALRKEKPSDRPRKLFDERGLTRTPVAEVVMNNSLVLHSCVWFGVAFLRA
jgi:hypothetical protein